jgi:two-component system chemotaxis response regulator CheY
LLKELRVVIADDSELIRGLLHQALSNVRGLNLVGMAENGAEAVQMTTELDPDLLVLDIAMPHKNGIEVLRDIRRRNENLLIVMFTADPSVILRDACLEGGANHYLDKSQIDVLLQICRDKLLAG